MNKKLGLILMITAFPAIFMIACSKSSNSPTTTPPPSSCDTVNMKYATDVVPILQNNCYSCHGTGNTIGSGGILLEGYSNLKPHAGDGSLSGDITHSPGHTAMPYQKPKLDDCTINKILDWINQGAPNN
jgi:hypothetical protein